MIQTSHILALSNRGFVAGQLISAFGGKKQAGRRESFWRGWGLPAIDSADA